ncbi:N-acetylglucosamine-6-phosphate deacetylase, partial [Streptomyces niveus]
MAARAESTVLAGARVVLPTGVVENGRMRVEAGRIASVGGEADQGVGVASVGGGASRGAPDASVLDLTGHWVVPGFVDMHNHGGGGASFTSGGVDEVLKGVRTHQEHGTTTLV